MWRFTFVIIVLLRMNIAIELNFPLSHAFKCQLIHIKYHTVLIQYNLKLLLWCLIFISVFLLKIGNMKETQTLLLSLLQVFTVRIKRLDTAFSVFSLFPLYTHTLK